jgi:hypothetical protein
MFKNRKLIFGIGVISLLLLSLGTVAAPNDVRQLVPVFNGDGDIVSVTYQITGPGSDRDAHVNVNTRELDANITITNKDTDKPIFNINNIPVNWCQNYSGPTGSYPTPNGVLMSGNTAENGTFFNIPKSQLVPGNYQIFMPFTYYEIVPGKDDRVVDNFIDGSTKYFVIKTNTTLTIDPIDNITVGDNVTITGSLTQDFDGAGLSDKLINITIGDQKYNVTTGDEGKFNLTVENLTLGDYTIEGVYNQNLLSAVYLTSNTVTGDFNVNKIPDPIDPVDPVDPVNPFKPVKPIPSSQLNSTDLANTGIFVPSFLILLLVLVVVLVAARRGE